MFMHPSQPLSYNAVKSVQCEKLNALLQYLQRNSPYYRELFATHRIDINKVRTIEDLRLIPTTGKEDLQQRNYDFICVAKNKIIEYTSTSGTLGAPVTVALTEKDLQRLAENEYTSFVCADGTPDEPRSSETR